MSSCLMSSVAKRVSPSTTTVPPPVKRLMTGMPTFRTRGMFSSVGGFLKHRRVEVI